MIFNAIQGWWLSNRVVSVLTPTPLLTADYMLVGDNRTNGTVCKRGCIKLRPHDTQAQK